MTLIHSGACSTLVRVQLWCVFHRSIALLHCAIANAALSHYCFAVILQAMGVKTTSSLMALVSSRMRPNTNTVGND